MFRILVSAFMFLNYGMAQTCNDNTGTVEIQSTCECGEVDLDQARLILFPMDGSIGWNGGSIHVNGQNYTYEGDGNTQRVIQANNGIVRFDFSKNKAPDNRSPDMYWSLQCYTTRKDIDTYDWSGSMNSNNARRLEEDFMEEAPIINMVIDVNITEVCKSDTCNPTQYCFNYECIATKICLNKNGTESQDECLCGLEQCSNGDFCFEDTCLNNALCQETTGTYQNIDACACLKQDCQNNQFCRVVNNIGECMNTPYKVFKEIGNPISNDHFSAFGSSVSLSDDGVVLAVGGPRDDNIGSVHIFEWNSNNWVERPRIDGNEPFEEYGSSISLSADGTILAIGAPNKNSQDNQYTNVGRVQIYKWAENENVWDKLGQDIYGIISYDYLGSTLSLNANGTRVAIGARKHDGNEKSKSGLTTIYDWNGTGWTQLGTNIYGENENDESGSSVTLNADGDIVAIGAPKNVDSNGIKSGYTRVFKWNGIDWQQMGRNIQGSYEDEYSGRSVSLSDDGFVLAVGGPKQGDDNTKPGNVRIHDWNGIAWIQRGQTIEGENAEDWFGGSISLSADGNVLAIGAKQHSGTKDYSGHVRIYKWKDTEWQQYSSDIDGIYENSNSGYSVSLSADGTKVAIGAPWYASGYGQTRVYNISESYFECTCANGVRDYDNCPSNGQEKCTTCDDGFGLTPDGICKPCTCVNGFAESNCDGLSQEKCKTCFNGFGMNSNECKQCYCYHGTPYSDCDGSSQEKCSSCDTGWAVSQEDHKCIQFIGLSNDVFIDSNGIVYSKSMNATQLRDAFNSKYTCNDGL